MRTLKVYQYRDSAPQYGKCWIATSVDECNGEQGWTSGKKPATGAEITKGVCDTLNAVGSMDKRMTSPKPRAIGRLEGGTIPHRPKWRTAHNDEFMDGCTRASHHNQQCLDRQLFSVESHLLGKII